MGTGKICGVCEEIKDEFCEHCSERGHFLDRKTKDPDRCVGKKEVLVAPLLVCKDCCLCPLLTYSVVRGARA